MNLEDMRIREGFEHIHPERDYTPKKRDLEIKFVSKKRKEIEKSNLPEEKKEAVIKLLEEYLIQYEKTYSQYELERKRRAVMINEAMYHALAFMN